MKCESCGNVLVGNEKFCNGCGAPVHTISNVANVAQPNNIIMPSNNNINSVNNNLNNSVMNNANSNVTENVMPPKKDNTKTIILVIILILLVGGGCAFGGYLLANNSDDNSTSEKEEKEEKPSNTSVYYAGVNFMLPNSYSYNQDEKGLYITNNEWLALLQENSLPFSSILLVKETLKSNLEQQGMQVVSMEEKTLSNKYLVFNANTGGINCLILMTEIKSGKTLLIMVTDSKGGSANTDWLNDIDEVLSNVEISNRENNIEFDYSILDIFNNSLIDSNKPVEEDTNDDNSNVDNPLVDVIIP